MQVKNDNQINSLKQHFIQIIQHSHNVCIFCDFIQNKQMLT